MTYVARFHRVGPLLMIASGVAAPAAILWATAHRRPAHPLAYVVYGFVAFAVLTGLGVARLSRGIRNRWIALSVDRDAITFGSPSGKPTRLAWDEVSALVLFSRRTEFIQGTVRCVGVRLHPCAAESPESHLAELRRARSRAGLTDEERALLAGLPDGPPGFDKEMAVSVHVEAHGWGYTRARLREAVRAYAPGVPVVERQAGSYYGLVGWRADREKVREITENAELRGCG